MLKKFTRIRNKFFKVFFKILLVFGFFVANTGVKPNIHAAEVVDTGRIEITKVDKDTNEFLEGAEFFIEDSRNLFVGSITTDAQGKGMSEELPLGEYKLVEVAPPAGYQFDFTPFTVTISAKDQVAQKIVTNAKIPLFPDKGKIKIVQRDFHTQAPLEGAEWEIHDYYGNIVDHIRSGPDGIALSIDLPLGYYRLHETKAPDGYSISGKDFSLQIKEKGEIVSIDRYNRKIPLARIEIIKVDSQTYSPLAGAEFIIKDRYGTIKDQITTNAEGYALTKDLVLDYYKLVEIKAPEGYQLNPVEIPIELFTENDIYAIQVDNDPLKGSIEIHKQDSIDGTSLMGAEFNILDVQGNVVSQLITDASGKAQTGFLPFGEYTIVETKSPEGYIPDTTPLPVNIASPIETKIIYNTKTPMSGKIEILKQDKDTATPLAGAEFDLIDISGNLIAQVVTDVEGKATSGLPLGNYVLVETKAPVGYDLDTTPIPVTIETNGQVVAQTIYNTKTQTVPEVGKIEITKQDKADGTKLIGAVFEVHDGLGTIIDTLITDTEGKATTIDLPLGNYNLVETVAPIGYELNPTPIPVTIATNGQVVTKTVDNTKTQIVPEIGKIEITKQDKADGTKLAGAEFEVKDENGAAVAHIVTDITGKATSVDLPLGNYLLIETVAPVGYDLDPTAIPVTLTTDGVTVTKTIDNTKTPVVPQVGKIEITKQDKADSTKLAGAEFDVKDANGVVVDHIVTDSTGKATTKELPLGTYTLVETKAPVGYDLDATPFSVTIMLNGQVVTKTVDNTKTPVVPQVGKIEITKQDKVDGTKLAGAEFDIKDENGAVIARVVTDIIGKAISGDLPLGNYTLVETKAPVGYDLDATPFSVTIMLNGQVVTKTVDNTKTPVVPQVGKIEITKQDKADGAKLAEAEFDVKDASGAVVDHVVTGTTGIVTTKELPLGTYTLVETKAPAGYTLDATPILVTIVTNGVTVTKTVDNTKTPVVPQVGKIEITKQDKADSTKLAGAVFEVRDGAGTLTDTLITDTTGKATSVNLPLGTYTLVETVAPAGYELDATPISMTIATNGQVVTKTVDNTKTLIVPQVGKIEITKQDKISGVKLSGAVFEVLDGAGESRGTLVTDSSGKATSSDLPLGTYTLVETKAPIGYVLDATPISVTLSTAGEIVQKTVVNIQYSEIGLVPSGGKVDSSFDTLGETDTLPDTGNSIPVLMVFTLILSVVLIKFCVIYHYLKTYATKR